MRVHMHICALCVVCCMYPKMRTGATLLSGLAAGLQPYLFRHWLRLKACAYVCAVCGVLHASAMRTGATLLSGLAVRCVMRVDSPQQIILKNFIKNLTF